MKRLVHFASLLVIVLSLLVVACQKKEDQTPAPTPTPTPTAVQQIKIDGVVTVTFPAGSITAQQKPTVTKVVQAATQEVFDETAALFRVEKQVPYQVVLNLGSTPALSDKIRVVFDLPADFKSALSAKSGVELFAQVYQEGELEVLDNFNILKTSYNPTAGTLSADLPTWVFTNARTADKSFEAIFMLASTPGTNLNINTLRLDGTAAATTADKCEAGQLVCPVDQATLCTSQPVGGKAFGDRLDPLNPAVTKTHWGVDFAVAANTPIKAASSGKIELVKTNAAGYGLYVVIRHTDKSATLYAHLTSASVKAGSDIKAGQVIGLSGNSGGRSTGPHLHFEYVPNGAIVQSKSRINPFPCISGGNGNGSITIRDDGNLADDAFALYLDDVEIGQTQIGKSNSISLSNLRPGDKTLRVLCTVAPDNVGTYELSLSDGLTFKSSGGSSVSSTLPQGGSASFTITVPAMPKLVLAGEEVNSAPDLTKRNAYVEHAVPVQ